jgi:molybdenum cofactor cytidylyltransferase
MGSSVRTGIERLVSIDADVAAAVLLLCDQPHVTPKVVSSLLAAHHINRKPVIASAYGESFGVPAVFSRTLFRELMGLAGSSGAKEVIKRHFSEAHFLPFPEGEVDVDTPDDFSCLT